MDVLFQHWPAGPFERVLIGPQGVLATSGLVSGLSLSVCVCVCAVEVSHPCFVFKKKVHFYFMLFCYMFQLEKSTMGYS